MGYDRSPSLIHMNKDGMRTEYLSLIHIYSLILFDEIGRGTSTYDGMALAQAMIEYIAVCIHAKTLFSTHYHELTSLDESLPVVKNVHVEVHEDNGHVTFMYRVKKGKADRSYGINVARPVSYTHLDVYKRQVEGFILAVGGLENIKMMHSSPTRLTIQVVDSSLINFSQIQRLGASRVVESRAGYSVNFGAGSTIIKNEINKRIKEMKRSA